jgi:hypothetical protein
MTSLDIQSINRDFLLVLRDIAGNDVGRACITFGIDRDFAIKASKLTIQQISHLASSYPVVVFKPRFGAEMLDAEIVASPRFAAQMVASAEGGRA